MVRLFFIPIFLVFIIPSYAIAAQRIALVIGNQTYTKDIGELHNPHKDIELVAGSLRKLEFEVRSLKDATRIQTLAAVSQFARDLGEAGEEGIGFFYYAGHGVANETNKNNYLIPTDIKDLNSAGAWFELVSLDEIIRILREGAPGANYFVVFDACRNELNVRMRSITRGFEVMYAKSNMLLAFSTAPNGSASDVGDHGGPYATALSKELIKPLWHGEVFQNVKEDVFKNTNRRQSPWEHSGITKRICLTPCQQVVNPLSVEPKAWKVQSSMSLKEGISKNQAIAVGTEIASVSDGRFRIDLLSPGAVVKAFQVHDAVSKGILDATFSSPKYVGGRSGSVFDIYSGEVPFGLPAPNFVRWLRAGGSDQLNAFYLKSGYAIHSIPCGLMGPKGQWARAPIRRVSDLKGMKIGISGLGRNVLSKLGVSVSGLPGGEILPAMERGLVDGFSYSAPLNDVERGILAPSGYYYYPGWQAPVEMLELAINLGKWESLGQSEKQLIEYVCRASIDRSLLDIITNEHIGLEAIRREGVSIERFPADVSLALSVASTRALEDEFARDPDFQNALKSYNAFR